MSGVRGGKGRAGSQQHRAFSTRSSVRRFRRLRRAEAARESRERTRKGKQHEQRGCPTDGKADPRMKREARGERAEDRGQRPEDRGQRPEDRGQRPEVRGQRSEVRGQRADDGGAATHARALHFCLLPFDLCLLPSDFAFCFHLPRHSTPDTRHPDEVGATTDEHGPVRRRLRVGGWTQMRAEVRGQRSEGTSHLTPDT